MNSYDHLFGEVAIQLKLLTREQLARCLNQQRHTPGKRLGEICVALGYLEPGQAQFILEQQAGVKKRRASQMVAAVPPPRRKKRQTLDALLAGYLDKMTGEEQSVSDQAAEDDPQDARVHPTARKERINRLSKMLARIIVDGDEEAEADVASPPQQQQQHRGARPAPAPQLRAEPAPRPAPPPAPEPELKPELEPELKPVAAPPPPQVDPAAPEWLESTSHEPVEPVATPAAVPPGTASTPVSDAAPAPVASTLRAHGPVTIPEGSLLYRALKAAAEHRASDLHLHSGSPLLLRRDGRLRPLPGESEPLDPERAARIIGEFMGEERWQEFLATREMDLACALPGVGRFRVNAYMQQRGPDVVFRLLPSEPPTLEALGLPPRLASMTQFRTGVVLCTGPTGCGKSTTLAALLNMVVQSRQEHIITIEDPIEFIYAGGKGLVNQRQIGAHTESFARALRAALREDPDVIGITELRDPETIALALSAAETGHLVLGSLHTGSAMQTITRIINAFPADQQSQVRVMLSESLRVVISQRLVARADGQGRAVALEVLVITPAVSNLIREDKAFQLPSAMQVGRGHGMLLLDDSLEQLVSDGTVTREEACKHATNPGRFGATGGAR